MIFDSSAFLVFRAENRLFKDPNPGINWYLTFHRFTVVHDYIQAPKSLFCAWQRLSGNVLAFDIFSSEPHRSARILNQILLLVNSARKFCIQILITM
jgi:hypothetical protein